MQIPLDVMIGTNTLFVLHGAVAWLRELRVLTTTEASQTPQSMRIGRAALPTLSPWSKLIPSLVLSHVWTHYHTLG